MKRSLRTVVCIRQQRLNPSKISIFNLMSEVIYQKFNFWKVHIISAHSGIVQKNLVRLSRRSERRGKLPVIFFYIFYLICRPVGKPLSRFARASFLGLLAAFFTLRSPRLRQPYGCFTTNQVGSCSHTLYLCAFFILKSKVFF